MTATDASEEVEVFSLLRCGSCCRRWLATGDRRADGVTPCPYCDDGTVGVLGVHHR